VEGRTAQDIVKTAQKTHFVHNSIHKLAYGEGEIERKALEAYPDPACSICYPVEQEKYLEFEALLRSLSVFDPHYSQKTITAFEELCGEVTTGNVLNLLETISFRCLPRKPAILVKTLSQTHDFNFSIPVRDIGEYPETSDIEEFERIARRVIKKVEKGKQAAEQASTSAQPVQRSRSFSDILFGRKPAPPSPEKDDSSESALEEGEIKENEDYTTTTPAGTPNYSNNDNTTFGPEVLTSLRTVEKVYQHFSKQASSTSLPELLIVQTQDTVPKQDTKKKVVQKKAQPKDDNKAKLDNKAPPVVDPQQKQGDPPQGQPANNPPVQAVPLPQGQPANNPPVQAAPIVQPALPPPPPQQPDDEDEMSHATYPVFDGVNPRKWIAEMEIAFIANNILAAANERRIGLAALNLGPAKMWFVTLNP